MAVSGHARRGGGAGRNFYGAVLVGERGQVVIPKEAREDFGIAAGDKLVVLGKPGGNLVLAKAERLREFAEKILKEVG